MYPRWHWEDRGKAGRCISPSQSINSKWPCWRSQARTGTSHRLCGEGCCSGEAAEDKTGAKTEEEDGHGHQLRII